MRFIRGLIHSLAALMCCAALAATVPTDGKELPPGIMASQPPEGQAVETREGFMVAYEQSLPGTDIRFTMVPVPGGEYEFARDDRTLRVTIRPFWIGRTEVTWAEYQEYMRLTQVFDLFNDRNIRAVSEDNAVDGVTAPSKLYEPRFTYETGDDPTQPAISMTQYAAKQYTKWLSLSTGQFFRLPGEVEWEYACRAGSKGRYCFGDDEDQLEAYAWYDDQNDYQTGSVATKRPNAWGLYDMHGNAAEWVLDAADPPEDYPTHRSVVTVDAAIAWPTKLFPRVLKGGSWDSAAHECTVVSRMESDDDQWKANDPNSPYSPWWFASYEGQQVGFRIVRPLDVPPRDEREKYWNADLPRTLEIVNRRIDKEGRGERGVVDAELSTAIEALSQP